MKLPAKLESLKWWWRSVQGLRSHIWLFREMQRVLKEYHKDEPFSEGAMKQIRQQEGMIGHCLLHVLCIYPNQDDGFGIDDGPRCERWFCLKPRWKEGSRFCRKHMDEPLVHGP